MLGFAAMAIDIGNLYLNKTELSTVADSAVLAGAQELPKNPTAASTVAKDLASKNGMAGDTVNVSIAADNKTIQVSASRKVTLFFAPVLNLAESTVNATATAKISNAASVPWIVPFVLPKTQNFDHTRVFTMRMYGKDNPYMKATDDPALQMDYMNVGIENTNFDAYINYLKNGYQKKFTVGHDMQYLAPSSGGKASVDAFYDRTQRDTNTDYTKAKVGDPRVMLIPLVETMLPRNTNEGTKMKIVGFVGFYLEYVYKGSYGTSFYAKGRFLKDINVGSGDSTTNPAYDFGVRTIQLVQ
jgi:Flp pilus assembly protein TadG